MKYVIAVLPGDGIGPEVVEQGVRVARAAADKFGFEVAWRYFPFGAEYYLKQGEILPNQALDDLAECQALLLGPLGDPRVNPGFLEQDLSLKLKLHFDQYLNLRPALSFPNVPLPVAIPEERRLDITVVRENTEDFYLGLGGRGTGFLDLGFAARRGLYDIDGQLKLHLAPCREASFSLGVMTRPAVARVSRRAFSLARERGESQLHVVTSSSAVPQLYSLWDEVTAEVAREEFPDLERLSVNVDDLCFLLPRHPLNFGVILCPNLFGSIVGNLVSALAGGLGLVPLANIGDALSSFEPAHGSTPGLYGSGRANPLAAILSVALMFRYLKWEEAALEVENAVFNYFSRYELPFELGGQATADQVGYQVADLVYG